MFKTKFVARSYNFLLAAACIAIVFTVGSFTEKGGSSANSFRGFCETASQQQNDTLPGKIPAGNSMDDTSIFDSGVMEKQIEEALRRVEERLARLEIDLQEHFDSRYKRNDYQLAQANKHLQQLKNETKASLLRAHAQYDRAMQQFTRENKRRVLNMQLQLQNARELALDHQLNLNLDLESNIKVNLDKAKKGMLKANENLKKLKEFKNDLIKDELINNEGPFLVEIKNGELYINDTKQSKKINKKYSTKYPEYFEGSGSFKLHFNEKKSKRETDHGLI